jgi:predicted nucleic acid-binding protein
MKIHQNLEKIKEILRLFNIFWDCKNLPLIPPAIDCNQSKTQKIIKSLEILECFQVLELEEPVYEVFAFLSAHLQSEGRTIGAFDELIAAITLCHDEKIVIRDGHFKEVPELEVICY